MSPARRAAAMLLAALLALAPAAPAGATSGSGPAFRIPVPDGWVWPVTGFLRVADPYRAPPHPYGAGHRGMDLVVSGAPRAPAAGIVAFAGMVVDRPLVTIDHGDGFVTTLEPVSPTVRAGDRVEAGQPVGALGEGGHSAPGALHFGVRYRGEYVNPLLLYGGIPRAVLVPCCG